MQQAKSIVAFIGLLIGLSGAAWTSIIIFLGHGAGWLIASLVIMPIAIGFPVYHGATSGQWLPALMLYGGFFVLFVMKNE